MTNPHSAKSSDPINYPEVLERIGGDAEFLEELLNIYFHEFQEKSSQIEAALAGADFIHIQEIGHSLKGASANLSLTSLRRVASALEAAAREKNAESARQALVSLVNECRLLREFLEQNPPADQCA